MFDPSIVTVWVLLRLVGLAILTVGLPLAISDITATNFTARMPGLLFLLGHDIVYFGIWKYHLAQEKPRNSILPNSGTPGTCGPPVSPLCPAEWPALPRLVGLITYDRRPQAGSDGVVQLV